MKRENGYALWQKINMIYTAGSDFHDSEGRNVMGIEIDISAM